jgi:hypothetical protein
MIQLQHQQKNNKIVNWVGIFHFLFLTKHSGTKNMLNVACFKNSEKQDWKSFQSLPTNHIRHRAGRIYIKGYLYPILYPKIGKRIFPILFWSRIFWGYNVLILVISKYYIHIPSRAMAVCTFLDSTIFSRWGPSWKDNTNFQRLSFVFWNQKYWALAKPYYIALDGGRWCLVVVADARWGYLGLVGACWG